MIKHLSLLFILIMSLLLAFFCVEHHTNSILAMFTLQKENTPLVIQSVKTVATKIPKPINTDNLPLIESVKRIEPVVVIKVDESEPIRPIIKKLSTKDLLGEEPMDEPILIKPIPTSIILKQKTENFDEIERKTLEEMSRKLATPTPTPTPTPTYYKPMVIEKTIVNERKIEKNNSSELSELERLMLEEIKKMK